MQVEELQVWHVCQGLPGEGGKGVSFQAEFIEVVKTPETVGCQRVQGIERHPEKLQIVEVVEGVARNPCDYRLLDT